jgi:glucose-1-phosphate thymidylyltransferase
MCVAAARQTAGATVFAYQVDDPQRYGVVTLDRSTGAPTAIVEKPPKPASNWAVTGLYYYDNRVLDIAADVTPSRRGELEITSINQAYLDAGDLRVTTLGRGYAWLDAGTHETLQEASSFVHAIEARQGLKIACLEEIALEQGFLSGSQVLAAANRMGKSPYADYLRRRVQELAE